MISSVYRIVCTYRDLRCYCANSSQWLFRPRGLSSQASLRGLGGPIIQPGPGGPYHPNLGLGGPIIQPWAWWALSSISHSRPILYPSNNYTRYMTLQSNGWGDWSSISEIKGFEQYSLRDGMGTLHCKENWIYVYAEKELRGLSPNSTLMWLWAMYIFPGSVNIFGCSKIDRPILVCHEGFLLLPCNN